MTIEEFRNKEFSNPENDAPVKKASHTWYAKKIMESYHFITLRETNEILVYENGVHKPGAETLIKEECEKRIKNCSSYMRNEVTKTIQASTYASRHDFDSDADLINLKNGLLNIRTGKCTEHTPEILCRIQIPVNYNPNAGPIEFMKFLLKCLPDYHDRITVIEEFANILIKSPNFEKVSVHVGGGSNGKSTFLKLIKSFLGSENIASVSIHDLITNRFAPARLDGKLANIYPDIDSTELKKFGKFKALVSGDPVDVEKKGKDAFLMENKAKMIFSCNQIPEIEEDTDAAFRRFLVTECNSQFRAVDEDDVEKGIYKKDAKLLEKLTTKQELSGILNLLIFTVKKMHRQNGFTFEQTIEQVRQIMKERADPIREFVNTYLVSDPNQMIPKADVYRLYGEFARKNNYIVKSVVEFNKKLKQIMNTQESTQKYQGKSTKVWLGITFNNKISEVTTVTNLTHQESKEKTQSTLFKEKEKQ